MARAAEHIHATAIALGQHAVLIRGPSGAGKSDLALRCLALGPSAIAGQRIELVADDQVALTRQGAILLASPPPSIAGKLEVRGLGIVTLDYLPQAEVRLVADLTDARLIDRHPDPNRSTELCGVRLPLFTLAAFELSAPLKLVMALQSSVAAWPRGE